MTPRYRALFRAAPGWTCLAIAATALLGACDDDSDPHLVSATTHLVQYDSCRDLERDLKSMVMREIDVNIERSTMNGGYGGYPPTEAGDSGAPTSDKAPRQEGVDYSGTNNQENGVDEADLVKTDGYHIYALNGHRLHIFGVPRFGELTPESVTELEGFPQEMLIDREAGRAVVFSMINASTLPEGHPLRASVGRYTDGYWYWRSQSVSKITVLDTHDTGHPTLVREVYFEGQYNTARKVENSIRVGSYASLEVPALYGWWKYYQDTGRDVAATRALAHRDVQAMSLDDFIPQLYVRTPDGHFASNSLSQSSCRSFYRPEDSHALGVASIFSFDLLGQTLRFDADHVLSNYPTFYASTDTLVITEAAHDWWWYWQWSDDPEHLNVHAFDISKPGVTRYIGSGRVEGWLFDSFSIDEEGGHIRLATTTALWNRWWKPNPPQPENHVWVLDARDGDLVKVGHLGGIAPGERIMTARMVGPRGYLVTFRNIDPLFTLDLSDPTEPRVVGELKVPGFSSYLHPMADGKLLSMGVGGDDRGANWRTQISMFDVSDFAHPALSSTLDLAMDGGWSWSEAQWEHKAFQYWAPQKLLAVPQSTYTNSYDQNGQYTYRYLSRLEVVNVDPATGLSRRGAIDHSAYYNQDPNRWWTYVDIRRSIFMGDFIYAISDKAITVHRVSDLGQVSAAELPGYSQNDSYYWWW